MYLTDRQRAIVAALKLEPLDHYQIAAGIAEAPFAVRAELRGPLRRERLVRETWTADFGRHQWKLTDKGERIAHNADQLELT